jgi:hypothetical protein
MTNSSAHILFALSLFAASLGACGTSAEDDGTATDDITIAQLRHRPPRPVTTTGSTVLAATTGSSTTASSTTGSSTTSGTGGAGGSSGSSSARSVACYSQGAPSTMCTGADHCCFNNYSAAHDGYCATDACPFGRIECDGPEDCASGNVCCAERISDPSGIALAYVVACRAGSACPSGTWQLCHDSAPATCGGRSCQPTGPINSELPRVIEVCAP